jgi:Xaa-Pro aminopeptidase
MSHAPSAALSARHHAVRQAITARSLDAFVVTSLPNTLYLTNFDGSSAITVMTQDRVYFMTDFRYITAATEMKGSPYECPELELVTVEGSYDATLAAVLASLPVRKIGFEAAHLTVNRYEWLRRTLPSGETSGPELTATEGIVEASRVIKDQYEIVTLREAARRLSTVAAGLSGEVRPGRREMEVAAAVDARLRDAGFEKPAFDTIVAAGTNAALPHARPGERRLREGDVVVLDFGGVYDSYCVDLTRTLVVGRASERVREVYGAVLEAHDRAIERVGPGRSRFEIDGAARDVLGERGLAEAFGHGTGHGLGIEVHEDPRITRRRTGDVEGEADLIKAGMVFTIEPGAYLPGWGGVRIEDDVLVTENGVEVLTNATTELIET